MKQGKFTINDEISSQTTSSIPTLAKIPLFRISKTHIKGDVSSGFIKSVIE